MSHTVMACPKCDDTNIRRRSKRNNGPKTERANYKCVMCGNEFDDPNRRNAKRQSKHSRHGLSSKLERMDPDDLS